MVVASTLQLALEQNVRQHGRLQQVTQDGTVLSDTDASLIQPEWSPPLQHALDQWRQLPDRVPGLDLVAVYARGSIPRGLALPGLSDVDTVGLATIQEPSNPALQSWRGQSAERAAAESVQAAATRCPGGPRAIIGRRGGCWRTSTQQAVIAHQL